MAKNNSDQQSTKRHKSQMVLACSMIGFLSIFVLIASFTSPISGGPVVIFLCLLVLLLFIFSTIALILKNVLRNVVKAKVSSSSVYYIAFSVALGAIFLIGLQTLQQLRLIDVILVLVLEVLINFYLTRRF